MAYPLTFIVHSGMALACLALPFQAISAIDMRPHIAVIDNSESYVEIINTGEQTEYVAIALYRLNNPGVPPDQESLTPLGITVQPLLFAAPMKLALGVNQRSRIALKARGAPEQEQVYRLSVMPQRNLTASGEKGAVIGVQIAYMGLVRHLPKKPAPQWHHSCEIEGILLYNKGNIRLSWRNLQVIDDFNLYPNQQRQLGVHKITGNVEGAPVNLSCQRSFRE
ncbi:hypothetical protein [Yersinia ruckeri]|uniref:Alpha-related fimbriae chaperone 2 n=1 Tax=Yersinia ruckeri TaxID=29486 RepID=A0A085U6K3_YERRU|nr:hypothetical protein QMA0440_03321 [Yersinia ruckeri]KGA45012.1 hypothetical protein DJ39_3136 [Yersinia ruckeri ATCC 29473]KFE38816.1 hypothetical protein nADLYRO1b_1867 [Yersinia ruckeri]QTD78181.1 Alpha-related fimbriae chaperone 2 [Yersinia ruckeri]CEK29094.1 Alpha-related fimbriae chaperone 2 [Yersinia ruckeri]